jgi:hypothetical protein
MSYSAVMLESYRSDAKAFNQARGNARREKLWSRLLGRSASLLCLKDVLDQSPDDLKHHVDHTQIPLKAIIGSVDRCSDYTRSFLPLKDSDQARWTRVERAFLQSKPLPPIQVRKVGQVYFVLDGHHRVSVARQLGLSHLEARVFQAETDPLVCC